MKQSLVRHLGAYHNLNSEELTVIRWCKICKQKITTQMPRHPCFQLNPICPPAEAANLEFKCRGCPRSFANNTGRKNHERSKCFKRGSTSPQHRINARSEVRSTETPPLSEEEFEIMQEIEGSQEINVYPAETSHAESTLPDSAPLFNDEDILNDITREGISLDDSPDTAPTDWDLVGEDLIPNPDLAAPTDCFLPRLKLLLQNYA